MKFNDWNANYTLAAGLAGSLVLWMTAGVVSQRLNKADTEENKVTPSFIVQVEQSDAQEYRRSIFVRGRSKSNRSVSVAAEIDGQVIATPSQEGSVVDKGEALCVLESEDRLLRLEQAEAQRHKALIDYEGALKLKDGNFQSRTQIAAAKANLAASEAELKASTLAHEKLVVRAPYRGVVQERKIEAGGFLQRGAACARLIELSPLVVVGHVPETDVAIMRQGDEAEAIFLSGDSHKGTLRYISRAADTLTRTFKIEVEIANKSLSLFDGLSADVHIFTDRFSAHRINPSLLTLMRDGNIGIKILDSDNIVNFIPVELVGDDEKGVWVTGLPDRAIIITLGQEYVVPGSKVTTVNRKKESRSTASLGSKLP